MRVGLIASPYTSVPPVRYSGTELLSPHLAEGLERVGIDAVVYCNGIDGAATEHFIGEAVTSEG